MNLPLANNMKGYKYLLPSKALMKRAEKKLKELQKKLRYKTMFFRRATKINGSIIVYEFVLYTRVYKKKTEQYFELTEVIDFKKRKGLISEKKQFVNVAGWVYRPNYHYYIYPYKIEKGRSLGGSLRHPDIYEKSKSYQELIINPYTKIPTKNVFYDKAQKLLEKDPHEVEFLWKAGFHNILGYKISKEMLEFMKKNQKHINKYIHLGDLRALFKLWKAFDGKKSVEYLKKFQRIYHEYELTSYTIKAIPRVINLINSGTAISHLKSFKKACKELGLNYNKEIYKGLKVRRVIINEYTEEVERQEAEYERQRLERLHKQNQDKYIKAQKSNKTLKEITKNFKHIEIDGFDFIPLRNMKDFMEISNKLELCLIQNEYYDKVKNGKELIYLVQPKGKPLSEAEVVQFYNKKELEVGQVSAKRNGKTENHELIRKIAETLTRKDLIYV